MFHAHTQRQHSLALGYANPVNLMYSFGQKALNVELFRHAWIIFWTLGCLKLMYTKAWTHWNSYGYDRKPEIQEKVCQEQIPVSTLRGPAFTSDRKTEQKPFT